MQGDRLNQASSLEFRVMRDGDTTDVVPCRRPAVYGSDFSFSLIFWQVSGLSPEKPLSPTYNFHKVFLRSADRFSRSTTDFLVTARLSSSGSMMSGSWQVAADTCCPLLHKGVGFTRGLAVVSDTFRDAYSGSSVIDHLGRSFRVDEDNYFGLRLTIKPLSRDTLGHPVTRPIDNINSAHLAMMYAGTLVPLVGTIPDWEIFSYFYRVDKHKKAAMYRYLFGSEGAHGARPPPPPYRFRALTLAYSDQKTFFFLSPSRIAAPPAKE